LVNAYFGFRFQKLVHSGALFTGSWAAIDQVIVFPFIRLDIEGIPRPTGRSSDIGAREFPVVSTYLYSNKGVFTKNPGFPGYLHPVGSRFYPGLPPSGSGKS
jgi:hypothetical protein